MPHCALLRPQKVSSVSGTHSHWLLSLQMVSAPAHPPQLGSRICPQRSTTSRGPHVASASSQRVSSVSGWQTEQVLSSWQVPSVHVPQLMVRIPPHWSVAEIPPHCAPDSAQSSLLLSGTHPMSMSATGVDISTVAMPMSMSATGVAGISGMVLAMSGVGVAWLFSEGMSAAGFMSASSAPSSTQTPPEQTRPGLLLPSCAHVSPARAPGGRLSSPR